MTSTTSTSSSPEQLRKMQLLLQAYLRLPPASAAISGALMEALVAHVHEAHVLRTYDFVDVLDERRACGWQVKSTKATTPVTWKRAKLANQDKMIEESKASPDARQHLGNAILGFCNDHAKASMARYTLDVVRYARLVVEQRQARYFERTLISRDQDTLFDPSDFRWHWSTPKRVSQKEQLSALYGVNRHTGNIWWAWHGQGENPLHFHGEREWWPGESDWAFTIAIPEREELISFDHLLELLDAYLPAHG